MQHEVKILEPTDLWYLQNNINKETNKFFHPTKNIPFVQQVEIKLENSGVIIQKAVYIVVWENLIMEPIKPIIELRISGYL